MSEMSEPTSLRFSDAEINQQALANASALPYLMVAFARACGRTPEEAAAFSGRIFAPGWARFAGIGADEMVRHMALGIVCCGGEVQELIGDATAAEVRVTGVPTEDEAAFFGITCEETDRYCDVFAPIAESLGFRYSWRRDGEALVLSVSRAGS
jgi:hypothetical protein